MAVSPKGLFAMSVVFCFASSEAKPLLWGPGLWFVFASTLGAWFVISLSFCLY